jgi:phosphoribosylglycinamide formyltransferase-1
MATNSERNSTMAEKLKVGTLISGGGTNLQAIIDACNQGRIDAQIVFTGSDVDGVKGLERANSDWWMWKKIVKKPCFL